MNRIHLDKIKSYESSPRIVNIFSNKEIKMMQQLYTDLPERVFNKKQNIKKKAWIQNYNKELDKIYFDKLKDVLGDFKMDTLKSETGEDFYGLFHESFSPLTLHVDSGFIEKDIIYKQVVTPLASFGDTVVFKNKWYGRSTSFTSDAGELKFKPKPECGDGAQAAPHDAVRVRPEPDHRPHVALVGGDGGADKDRTSQGRKNVVKT